MWYHLSGNSVSVSTRHSHLGKLGSKCRGHPVVHRQLPPWWSAWVLRELQTEWHAPSTSIPPHEKLQVLTDVVSEILGCYTCNRLNLQGIRLIQWSNRLDYLFNRLKFYSQNLEIAQEQCNWLDTQSNQLKCSCSLLKHL